MQELSALGKHQHNEHEFAENGNDENERADARVKGTVDEHESHETDQRAPIAHDDVGERALQGLPERRAQRRLRRDGGVGHRAGQRPR